MSIRVRHYSAFIYNIKRFHEVITMKFIHTSDLHIGKKVHGLSMIDDQRYILKKILDLIKSEKADALLIAGDVYDKTVPSEEAVAIFNELLTELHDIDCEIFMIYGNHDSAQRLSFGSGILSEQGVQITDIFNGTMEKRTLEDEFGKVNIWMLPFIKPSTVRQFYPNKEINNSNDAAKCIIESSNIDLNERNILIAHQFVISKNFEPELGGSEECRPSVGGTDYISSNLFDKFDYVALGHIHKPQFIGRETVRYSGSPLKYSESEHLDIKGVVSVELFSKNEVSIETISLIPKRDLRIIEGTVEQLKDPAIVSEADPEDYVYVKLTENTIDAKAKLNEVYPNIMAIVFPGTFSDQELPELDVNRIKNLKPLELFQELFRTINGKEMTEDQNKIFNKAVEEAREESQ